MTETLRRWRLALGRFAGERLGELSDPDARRDQALDYLYGREYRARGLQGGFGAPQVTAVDWLTEARRLFPSDVFEVLQGHALQRYALTELLQDDRVLAALEPSRESLRVLLALQRSADPALQAKLRAVVRRIVEDLTQRLKTRVERAFSGRRNRFQRSSIASAANFDWRATLRRNLHRYDPERRRILAEELRFNARSRRKLPWEVVLCVDQSGSMSDSLIHAAVMAAILAGLPGVRVKMVLFDTAIVDVTDRLADPLATLLTVTLGGGTNIGAAVAYAEAQITAPERTVFALITDFAEGASPRPLYAALARMSAARVRMIGLTALSDEGEPAFDRQIAGTCAGLGMKIAAMSPDHFADWLAGVLR